MSRQITQHKYDGEHEFPVTKQRFSLVSSVEIDKGSNDFGTDHKKKHYETFTNYHFKIMFVIQSFPVPEDLPRVGAPSRHALGMPSAHRLYPIY